MQQGLLLAKLCAVEKSPQNPRLGSDSGRDTGFPAHSEDETVVEEFCFPLLCNH